LKRIPFTFHIQINSMLKKVLKRTAGKLGVNLESNYTFQQSEKYKELLERLLLLPTKSFENNELTFVIFSKNRALQLSALLKSIKYFCDFFPQTFVLYNFDNNEFEEGYKKLIKSNDFNEITFVKETSFRLNLIETLKSIKTNKLIFLVDDIFFKNKVDLKAFSKLDTRLFVPSLRHGNHLDFAYTVQQKQKLPNFIQAEPYLNMLQWHYDYAELDWAYPLSVDGHLFATDEMQVLVENLSYTAPNSFEAALQLMKPLFSKRLGICFKESVIVNNPCNKVQSENFNYHGKITSEELNNQWLMDFEFDFLQYQGLKNNSVHQELAIKLIKNAH
jgi:hypothetical protein